MRFDKIGAITPTEYSRDVYIDRILSKLGSKVKSVCDVGCGIGHLLLAFEDRLIEAKGIDTSDESLNFARARIRSSHIKLEKKDVFELDEQFDLVFLNDVLEHVPDDKGMIRFLHDKVVRKGGYLVLTVPAHSRLYSKFDSNAGHYRRYDKTALLTLIRENGFEPDLCWSYGQLLFHYAANAMLLFDKRGRETPGPKTDEVLSQRTRVSAIREYSGITKFLVSRVNIIHRFCFTFDCLFKNHSLGIAYCLLCRSR